MNAVYDLRAMRVATTPIAEMPIQVMTVKFQPKTEVAAMPYIEIAAPIYTHALQSPLAVAERPIAEKRPGKQEMSRKFIACINAHTRAASTRQTIRMAALPKPISKDRGTQVTAEAANITREPRTSLPKRGCL